MIPLTQISAMLTSIFLVTPQFAPIQQTPFLQVATPSAFFQKFAYFEPEIPEELPAKKEKVTSKEDIIALARKIAQEKQISEPLFIDIMLKESSASSTVRGDMGIICKQGVNKGKPVEARGVFQITKCHNSEITDEQAFDPEWSMYWAAEHFKKGNIAIWHSWRLIK